MHRDNRMSVLKNGKTANWLRMIEIYLESFVKRRQITAVNLTDLLLETAGKLLSIRTAKLLINRDR